ncbi:MAG: CoA ester lyase [Rhodobacteraceae bacterium]|nr:CoA ester lyase [Paracoccaceae bacterium]
MTRSWLFVPGDSPRKMEKSLGSGADALILDLEDSVPAEGKALARREVGRFLAQPAPMPRHVRINALDTGLAEADIAATIAARPAGYVLPKCEGPDDIDRLARMIAAVGTPVPITVIATETARGLRRLQREDWAHPALGAITWGGEDLSADLGASRNRDGAGRYLPLFQSARDTALLAAREAGVVALDGVYTALDDPDGLEAEARAAVALGFDGKLAIHPAQIPVIHRAFMPDAAQLDWARQVVAVLAQDGAARLNGQMLDRPHLRQAQRLLARAGQAG